MDDLRRRRGSASAALIITAVAVCLTATVMYLRMSLLYPLAGDDPRNTVTNYYYITHISPLDYIKDVLDTILRGRLETTNRCFPFAMFFGWPRYLASGSIVTYRLYIIAVTCVALLLNAALWWRVTKDRWFALACLAFTPLMFSICARYDSNAFYSYHALVQQTLIWFLLSAHATVSWARTRHWRWALIALFFTVVCCGTYEIGYVFIFALGFLCLMLHDRFWTAVCTGLPALCGEVLSFLRYCYVVGTEGMNGEITVSMKASGIVRAWVQQMSGAFPYNEMIASKRPLFVSYTLGDFFWPLLLVLVAGWALCKACAALDRRKKLCLVGFGVSLLVFPAVLIAVTGKFQDEHWLSWEHSWLPAVVESFGVALIALVLLQAGFQWLRSGGVRRAASVVLLAAFATVLTAGSAWQRASVRHEGLHYQPVVQNYELRARSMEDGLLDQVPEKATVVCDYTVWGGNVDVQSMYLQRYTDRELSGWDQDSWRGASERPETSSLYGMGVSEGFTAYDAVWMAKAQNADATLLQDPVLYVDGDCVPADACLTYLIDDGGGEEPVSVPLRELPHGESNGDNEYFMQLSDENIIWDSFSFVP